jgi:predicted transcriptional regulator YheO
VRRKGKKQMASQKNKEYKKNIIESYVPLVDFLAGVFGKDCEIVLHLLDNLDSSIVAIGNGHISSRGVGGCITDFALKKLKEHADNEPLVGYRGKTEDGKHLVSSTLFLKDLEGEVFALLCINIDVTNIITIQKGFADLIESFGEHHTLKKTVFEDDTPPIEENFSNSVDDLLNSLITDTLKITKIPPERMSMEEKISIVNELEKKGVFLIKGSVVVVAKKLKISESSLYRYFRFISDSA